MGKVHGQTAACRSGNQENQVIVRCCGLTSHRKAASTVCTSVQAARLPRFRTIDPVNQTTELIGQLSADLYKWHGGAVVATGVSHPTNANGGGRNTVLKKKNSFKKNSQNPFPWAQCA